MNDNGDILKALHALVESNKAINTTLVAVLAHLVRLEDRKYAGWKERGENAPLDYNFCTSQASGIIRNVERNLMPKD